MKKGLVHNTYFSWTSVVKEIDTVDGSYNEYLAPDADVYTKSSMVICYAVGLGHYFKIINDGTNYRVMRKMFEENHPEYNPSEQPFNMVVQF